MSNSIKHLSVFGLHDQHDVHIDFNDHINIFMGPNGVGKSTILNIFVYFLSRQWQRLSRQSFISAIITFESGEVATIARSECADLNIVEVSPRTYQIATLLTEEGILEEVLDGRDLSDIQTNLENRSSLAPRDIRLFRNNILQYGDASRSLVSLSKASKTIQKNFYSKLIYLPTYRRIEQDISEVFSMSPSTVNRIQRDIDDAVSHSSSGYAELVRFGMDDILKLLNSFTSDIKEYSRQQINSLSTRYLTAALQTRQPFAREFFTNLTDTQIKDILGRVDDEELNKSQRTSLTNLIKTLRSRDASGRLSRQQEHIAGYFPMLAETHERISKREVSLQKLATILNAYIGPTKIASYDQTKYEFEIKSGEKIIPLSGLSSGEKQIVSLFASLMLNSDGDLFVIIDEPELSLSVLWQELLVEDIMSIEGCKNILAVTHSPFIYGEKLSRHTRDLSDHTSLSGSSRG